MNSNGNGRFPAFTFPRIEREIDLGDFEPGYAGLKLSVRVNLSRRNYGILFRQQASGDEDAYRAALADLLGIEPESVEAAWQNMPPEVWTWLLMTRIDRDGEDPTVHWPRIKEVIDDFRQEHAKNSSAPLPTG